MRRGFALLFSVSALGLLSPAAFGQYPYPYGPMPVQYGPLPPGYGYPPTPAYSPHPMMAQPRYYPPAPAGQYPPPRNTKVFVYGPLTDEAPMSAPPNALAAPMRTDALPVPQPSAAPVHQAQAPVQAIPMRGGYRTLPTYSKADIMPDEACGPGCDDCGPSCGPVRRVNTPPMRGHGHFFGEVGSYFLVPYFDSRAAFTSTPGGTTDFDQQLYAGARASVGYMFHTGWGVRGNYWYQQGAISENTGNGSAATTISTPFGAALSSPGAALAAGAGADGFTFSQRLAMHVADVELLKECSFLDTTFLFSFGGRYANVRQSYSATRSNQGGVAGGTTFATDRTDGDISNHFEGYGPTVSFEAVHPIACGFSTYGNLRGSVLFGTDRFNRNTTTQVRSVTGGVANFTDTFTSNDVNDTRRVSIGEAEAGVQYGIRLGRCFVFARAGAVFQRWWDVGNPSTADGNINFVGGTARLGISY